MTLPTMVSSGNSLIDNTHFNYFHESTDVRPVMDDPFGAIRLNRSFRSRDISNTSSFGPGFFSNYDLKLLVSYDGRINSGSYFLFIFDPAMFHPQRLDFQDGAFREIHAARGAATAQVFRTDGSVATNLTETENGATAASIASAIVSRPDGAKFYFEKLVNLNSGANAFHSDQFRLTRWEDQSGHGTDLTYKTWTQAEINSAPDRQWQIDTITDAYGQTLTFTYGAQQVGGRWAVSQVVSSTSGSVSYSYNTEKLAGVTLSTGEQATFTYTTSYGQPGPAPDYYVPTHDEITFFDPAASQGHRRKTVFLSSNMIGAGAGGNEHIFNSASRLVRKVTNGAGEISYMNFPTSAGTSPPSIPDANTNRVAIYEGRGKLSIITPAFPRSVENLTDDWSFVPNDLDVTGTPDNIAVQEFHSNDAFVEATGRPRRTTDKRGILKEYDYDDNGNLSRVRHADATTEVYCRDDAGRVLRYRDRLGRISKYTYDVMGNMLTEEVGITGPEGVSPGSGTGGTGTGAGSGGPNGEPDPVNVCDDSLDVQVAGEYAKYEWQYYPAAHVNEYRLSAAIDPLGNTSNYEYDTAGRLTKVIQPPDVVSGPRAETTYAYDTAGRLASVTNPLSQTVTFEYDLRGRRIKTTYADGSTDRVVYGANSSGDENLVVRTINRMNVATDYEYDGDGRMTRKLEATFIVSASGTESAVSDPSVTSETTYEYLEGTRLVSKQVVEGSRTDYSYDYAHRLVSTTVYPNANTTLTSAKTYVNNQLFKTTDPYGRSTFYAYDATDGRLIRGIVGTVPEVDYTDYAAVLAAVRDPDGTPNSTSLISDYIRNAESEIVESIDARGLVHTALYDSRGYQTVTQIAAKWADGSPSSLSARTETDYDAVGNVVRVRKPRYFDSNDAAGYQKCETLYTYNGRNQLASRSEAPNSLIAGVESYQYNLQGLEVVRTDELGNVWTTVYSPCCGKRLAEIDPLGHGTIYNTDSLGRVTHEIQVANVLAHTYIDPTDADTYGEITRKYDEAGRIVAETEWVTPLGAVDPAVPPIYSGPPVNNSANPPSGQWGLTISYKYDGDITDGIGLDSTLADYLVGIPAASSDSTGSCTLVTSPSGRQRVQIRDGVGRRVRASVISNNVGQRVATTSIFDDVSVVTGYGTVVETSQHQGLGMTQTARVDKAGRIIETLTAGVVAEKRAYNADGDPISIRDASNVGKNFSYDSLGRAIVTQPTESGPVVTTEFNLAGAITRITDETNSATNNGYDARGRKVASTDRLGFTTSWTYDLVGNELSMTDPESQTTSYTYDVRNQQTQIEWPDHVAGTSPGGLDYGIETVAFDPAGRPEVTTRQDGTTVKLLYDLPGRMTAREYRGLGVALTAAAANTDTLSYEADGKLISGFKDDYDNTISFTYNDAGQLITESMTVDSNTYTIQSTYNLTGDLASIEDPTGFQTQYTYLTSPGRPIDTISKQPSGSAVTQLADFAYDAAGRETSRTLGVGAGATTTTRSYDGVGRLSSIDNDTHGELDFTYTYDSVGNIASETRGGTMSGASWTAAYDDDQRLTTWDVSNGDDESWNLSAVGNWDTYNLGTASQNFTHGDTHELTNVAGVPGPDGPPAGALTYDSRGNMTADTNGLTYTWDADGMLASVTVPNGAAVGIEGTHTYEYDVLGRRLVKVIDDVPNSTVIKTIFIQRLVSLPPLGNRSRGGQVVAEYESDDGGTPSLSRRYVYGNYVDEPVWQDEPADSDQYYFHQDRRFNVAGITRSADNLVLATIAYNTYGRRDPALTAQGQAASVHRVKFGFTGRLHDYESACVYFRSRFYLPLLGRFISRDRLRYVDGENSYAAYLCPSGLDPSGSRIQPGRKRICDKFKPTWLSNPQEKAATDEELLECIGEAENMADVQKCYDKSIGVGLTGNQIDQLSKHLCCMSRALRGKPYKTDPCQCSRSKPPGNCKKPTECRDPADCHGCCEYTNCSRLLSQFLSGDYKKFPDFDLPPCLASCSQ